MTSNTWFSRRKRCPVCDSQDVETIYSASYERDDVKSYLSSFYSTQGGVEWECLDGAVYELRECKVCFAVFQRDIPNDALMERLYEHWIDPELASEQHKASDSLGYRALIAQEIMQVIAYFRKPPSSLNFLDYGMGWGKWALMAKAFGCNSSGAELSAARIANAKANAINVITSVDLSEQSFDFVNTEQVFEHLPEPLDTLRQLKRTLKPNGVIRISVPTANNIEQRLKHMNWTAPKPSKISVNPVAPLEHINYFRRSSLVMMASKAGLSEISIPIKQQIKHSTNWGGVKKCMSNLLVPIMQEVFKRKNCIFLRNAERNES